MSQAPAIVASNRTEELGNTLKDLVLERRALDDSGRLWSGILRVLKKHMGSVEFVSKYAFIALFAVPVAKQNSASVVSGGFEFSRSVAWASDNAADLKKNEHNLRNVRNVIELMERPVTTSHFDRTELQQPGIQLLDASVGVGDDEFIKDININLGPGRHVLVGKNGKGKSTLLKQIVGQRDHHAWSKGKLRSSGTMLFVPQHEYWMPYQTLAGALGVDARKEACELVGICRNDWDEVKRDWGTTLSGGEKKKLALLAAVSKKPDILILDEIFDGMDPEAIEQSKKLIRLLGPKTTVIIVDHEYEAHNKDKFYGHIIEITPDKRVQMQNLN
jgi:ABC-type Mn2+/Zn2+ transport system ATPase subunit